jgi:putative hemolysin
MFVVILTISGLTIACSQPHRSGSVDLHDSSIANPSYQKCIDEGFKIEQIIENGIPVDAYCINTLTGKKCKIWAYFRGECSMDGSD